MRRLPAVLLVLILAAASLALRKPVSGLAAHAGNHYLSETYGFRVNWDDRVWFVVQQGPDRGWDQIALSDGIAYVFFSGGAGYAGQVQPCLDDTVRSMQRAQGIANLAPLTGNNGQLVRGKTDGRAFAAYTYSYSLTDGTTADFVRYTECRTMVAGESVITIDLVAPARAYDDEFRSAQDLLAGLALPSPGEAAPVFVAGQWRLAIAGVTRGGSIRTAGLAPKNGKDWLLVVVDATDWGSSDAKLDVKGIGLSLDGRATPIHPTPGSTVAAARALGTGPATANEAVAIAAGQTRRLTLVFQIPHSATGPALVLAGNALPLDAIATPDDRLGDLPVPVGPPFLREARVESVVSSELLTVVYLSDNARSVVRLVGTQGPLAGDCYGEQTLAWLARLVGRTVRVEREADTLLTGYLWVDGPGQAGRGCPAPADTLLTGYLWVDGGDGVPTLVNQQLIAGGFAVVRPDEQSGRFGAWLAESEREAHARHAGRWGRCAAAGDNAPATPTAATPSAG